MCSSDLRLNIFIKTGYLLGVLLLPDKCIAIIDKLIELRKAKGLTQKELAQASSLTQSVIARLESKKATPQLDTLLKVASALGCEIELVPASR